MVAVDDIFLSHAVVRIDPKGWPSAIQSLISVVTV
jgi:hypothetical protein